ncbi:MAG: hypothetical protein NT160_03830 [Actinobacteria bacterium]|nr:hypothetical protein [Actinomycetota bacterium]
MIGNQGTEKGLENAGETKQNLTHRRSPRRCEVRSSWLSMPQSFSTPRHDHFCFSYVEHIGDDESPSPDDPRA